MFKMGITFCSPQLVCKKQPLKPFKEEKQLFYFLWKDSSSFYRHKYMGLVTMNSPASRWVPQRQAQPLQRELPLDLVFFGTTWVTESVWTLGCQRVAGIEDHLVSKLFISK